MKFGNMSRIGKLPIEIPAGVEVKIEGRKVHVKGPKGELEIQSRPEIKLEVAENAVTCTPVDESVQTKAYWGLTRSLIANMIEGVVSGYEKKLEIEGVGYRAAAEGEKLVLNVGFSHPVNLSPPEGVSFAVEGNNITVTGIDKGLVTQFASKIRKAKPAEPYKGKGIHYEGEVVRRKLGKRAVGAEGA